MYGFLQTCCIGRIALHPLFAVRPLFQLLHIVRKVPFLGMFPNVIQHGGTAISRDALLGLTKKGSWN